MSIDITSIPSAAFSGLIGSIVTAIVSLIVVCTKNNGTKKELEAAKAEIQYLKRRLEESIANPLHIKDGIYHDTNDNPYTLSPGGFYVDAAGVRYCGAGCHDDLTAQRIPLKPVSASCQWLYECPKCKTTYQVADPPLPQPANWNPLA